MYGGKFTDGYNSFPYSDGSRNFINAGNDVIIVAMNYRVGPFGIQQFDPGFLPSLELAEEGSANAGVMDVAAAFQWVRKHIYAFGGDPNRVTGFGLSSGGCTMKSNIVILATLLMAEDGQLDLFDRVFLQSGSAIPVFDTPDQGEYVFENLMSQLKHKCTVGQTSLQCLRDLPAQDLLDASLRTNKQLNSAILTSYGPVLDGKFIRRQHFDSLRLGLFRKIPLMVSTTKDEGVFLTRAKILDTKEMTPYEFEHKLFRFFNESDLKVIEKEYSHDLSEDGIENYNLSRVATDFYFQV